MHGTTATHHIISLLLERSLKIKMVNVKDIRTSIKRIIQRILQTLYDAVKPTPENIRWFICAIIRFIVYILIWEQFICKQYSLF